MHSFDVLSDVWSESSGIDQLLTPDLLQRAKTVGRQMSYFLLATREASFEELLLSASRAGFTLVNKCPQEKGACFRWSIGEPDFTFSVSFKEPKKVEVVAESCGDIAGLVLVGHSHVNEISMDTKPRLPREELGPNAIWFREILLTFPVWPQRQHGQSSGTRSVGFIGRYAKAAWIFAKCIMRPVTTRWPFASVKRT